MRVLASIILCVAIAFVGLETTAEAKYKERIKSDYTQLWNATVRLLRVDLDWEIVDKDKETGFIIFRYSKSEQTPSRATIEIISDKSGENKTSDSFYVQIQIPAASSIEERMLAGQLKKKLAGER